MKIVKLGILILAVLFIPTAVLGQGALVAGIDEPTATSFQVGQTINFTASATGGSAPYSFTWNFGDGDAAFGDQYEKVYTEAGEYEVTLTVSDFNEVVVTDTVQIKITDPVAPIEVEITSPLDGVVGLVNQTVTFRASATGGSAPYSFTWNFGDGDAAFGDQYEKVYTEAGEYVVEVIGSDFNEQTDSDSIVFKVESGSTTTPPTVDLKANNSDGPLTVSSSTEVTLSWSTTDAETCVASGDWSGAKSIGDSELLGTLPSGSQRTYTLNCTGPGGSANDTVAVNVSSDGGGNPPSVDLKVNGSDGPVTVQGSQTASTTINLLWTTTDATTCTASGNWSGAKSLSGSESIVLPPTSVDLNRSYTLNCTGPDGSASDTVSLTLDIPSDGDPLTISNIRVTDITKTSVIIRWDTNRPATSRVIYDTVSHPSITGAAAPNYGYAFSTATDSNLVSEHAVTVSGLAPATQYFFRVISEG